MRRLPTCQSRGTTRYQLCLYANLTGEHGLETLDPTWKQILQPDHTGFRGCCCTAVVRCTCGPAQFNDDGFLIIRNDQAGKDVYESVDGDVVCFELLATDDLGFHMPVMTNDFTGAFPPNTLYRLKAIVPAGEWECPAPFVYPKQRLLIVTATYRWIPNSRRTTCSSRSSANRSHRSRMATAPPT